MPYSDAKKVSCSRCKAEIEQDCKEPSGKKRRPHMDRFFAAVAAKAKLETEKKLREDRAVKGLALSLLRSFVQGLGIGFAAGFTGGGSADDKFEEKVKELRKEVGPCRIK